MMRIIRKRRLEMILERLRPHPNPKLMLEQYTIPAEAAAEILFIAAYTYGDVEGKSVADLGCGTGRLGIGAAILGARRVLGVDVDEEAIGVALENSKLLGVEDKVCWVVSDIQAVKGGFDTVIMNPPFGTKVKHMDTLFLSKAMEVAKVVYSLHKSSTRRYILDFVRDTGGTVNAIFQIKLKIPWTFKFHKKRVYVIDVDLYRVISAL